MKKLPAKKATGRKPFTAEPLIRMQVLFPKSQHAWLSQGGNASFRLRQLVDAAMQAEIPKD